MCERLKKRQRKAGDHRFNIYVRSPTAPLADDDEVELAHDVDIQTTYELTGLRPQVIDKFIVRGGGDGIV